MNKTITCIKGIAFAAGMAVTLTNCSEYLDVVPDGTATLETVFSNRVNAEKFFYTCYNNLPNFADAVNYPGNIGGDDYWWDIDVSGFANSPGGRLARGEQNVTEPYENYWDGGNGGKNIWQGIRNCNLFLENIDQVPDMEEWEKVRWKAEAKFLKAYFHFFLLQLYGPVPITDKNIEVSASPEEVRVYRSPVDSVVNYVCRLIDESVRDLPLIPEDLSQEAGRATIPMALSVKAKALVWAASPIFNGSFSYYQGFKDSRGVQLITTDNSNEAIRNRWERAAVAIKNAIDTCQLAGHSLFRFDPAFNTMSEPTRLKYTLRGVATERVNLNPEIIWPCTKSNNSFQNNCTPRIYQNYAGTSEICATLKMAELFYTRNGLPINEDPYWDYDNRYKTRKDTGSWHQYYIEKGAVTANLNFQREPRFYANLGFDKGIYELINTPEAQALVIKNKSGEAHGYVYQDCHISTGYFIKKQVSFRIPASASSPSPYRFSIPIIRLADLYLLYAEALNESNDTPTDEVYAWVDSVRARAGLEGVVETWQSASPAYRNKPYTKDGMRNIIKQERLIELAFEGQRTFDLRRWGDAMAVLNEPVRGWDYQSTTTEEYYRTRVYSNSRQFSFKDYLWPLRNNTLIRNGNLVQNPGW
ncbi:MAG: RagB/SusD family nutrient uptake outer membrane protein [Mangrovibacterium sp.]